MVNEDFIDKPTRLFHIFRDIGTNPKGKGDSQLDYVKENPDESNFKYEDTLTQTIMRYNQLTTVQVHRLQSLVTSLSSLVTWLSVISLVLRVRRIKKRTNNLVVNIW